MYEILKNMENKLNDDNTKLELEQMMKLLNEFLLRVQCIISQYETMKNNDKESIGLDIKLPKIDNITDLKKCIDGLEFVFSK